MLHGLAKHQEPVAVTTMAQRNSLWLSDNEVSKERNRGFNYFFPWNLRVLEIKKYICSSTTNAQKHSWIPPYCGCSYSAVRSLQWLCYPLYSSSKNSYQLPFKNRCCKLLQYEITYKIHQRNEDHFLLSSSAILCHVKIKTREKKKEGI